MQRVKTAVLGATGIVGQVFVWMLSRHEWFETSALIASDSKIGRLYGDEVHWQLPVPMPESARELALETLDPAALEHYGVRIVFSALPADVALDVEPKLTEHGFFVFSNASAMRHEAFVPILIPEVNPASLQLIEKQGFPENGFIVTNANCSATGIAVALAPLVRFGIREAFISTYQAVSGAGYPGLPALDISGNAIPHIRGEEEKITTELGKILGLETGIYPHCVRIPTRFGHLITVWLTLDQPVTRDEVIEAWHGLGSNIPSLPSRPDRTILYNGGADFPQPRMCFDGSPPGMSVFTGRLKTIENRIGFTLLVNNLVKGAAGGSIENAEYFIQTYGEKL